ncbi:MAG: hypothetical protein QW409_00940 [Candidatus Aenigmatarchaeota archaeon]
MKIQNTNYPKEILSYKNEYVRFFVKRFPFEIFQILMKPHLENKRFSYIIKEITEVVGIFNVLNSIIKKEKIESFVLYELASGDALFSHFVAKIFPKAKVFAIDLNFPEELKEENKSKFFENLFLIEKNIEELKNVDSDFVVAIHACTKLSEIAIDLSKKFFIIMPCCIGSENYERWKKENKILDSFFNAINNEYYKWVLYLGSYAKQKGFEIKFKKDEKILSERNFIIVGKK